MNQNIKQAIAQAQFKRAIKLAQETLGRSPSEKEQVDTQYLLAVALRLDKQLLLALSTALQLSKAQPSHARAFQEVAYCYRELGQPKETAMAFYKAVQLNPALLSSWRELEKLYRQMGNGEAAKLASSQVAYLSGLPAPILGARDLMHESELHKADQVCRHYLQQHKHDAEALLLLAEIGIQLKVYGEAEFLLESCLELYPDHAAAGMAYLKLLSKMGKFEQAYKLAEKLLQGAPGSAPLLSARASALVGIGQVGQAIAQYQELLQGNPDQPGIQLLLGHAQKAAGDLPAAIQAYQQAYHYKADFGDAFWSLANTKTYQFTGQEMAQMRQCSQDPALALDDRIHMLFALGKAYEDAGDYAESFDLYAQGNALKQQSLGYQPEFIEKQVQAQIEHCPKSLFDQLGAAGEPAPDPIFILGLPRSGSTLLEQILASHPMVDGTMELHNILGLVSRLRGQQNRYPELLGQLEPCYFQSFGQQYLQETQVYRRTAPFFIDKMPNNFVHIGLIKLILPNAKIIDARREPMACCFSNFKQLFGEGQEFSYSLESLGRYYQAYLNMMAHWDEVLPGAVLRVQHEDVIDDLEGQVCRLLEYCGLPFEQACVEFHKTKRTVKTPSSEQVRQPIYRDGLAQWRHFEPYLQELKAVLQPG